MSVYILNSSNPASALTGTLYLSSSGSFSCSGPDRRRTRRFTGGHRQRHIQLIGSAIQVVGTVSKAAGATVGPGPRSTGSGQGRGRPAGRSDHSQPHGHCGLHQHEFWLADHQPQALVRLSCQVRELDVRPRRLRSHRAPPASRAVGVTFCTTPAAANPNTGGTYGGISFGSTGTVVGRRGICRHPLLPVCDQSDGDDHRRQITALNLSGVIYAAGRHAVPDRWRTRSTARWMSTASRPVAPPSPTA